MLHKTFICTCLKSFQQQLLTTTGIQTTTGWTNSCFNKETYFTSYEPFLVLYLHINDWLDNKPIKHAFRTNDPSGQACRKRPLGLFSKRWNTSSLSPFGDQVNFSQVNMASHACQRNKNCMLITHTCSKTRKSSTSMCSCISCSCMHFILQLSLKHTVLSKMKWNIM